MGQQSTRNLTDDYKNKTIILLPFEGITREQWL